MIGGGFFHPFQQFRRACRLLSLCCVKEFPLYSDTTFRMLLWEHAVANRWFSMGNEMPIITFKAGRMRA